MSIGTSGRIVIEIDPALKRELHGALAKQGTSLKDWFLRQATQFLEQGDQLSLLAPQAETSRIRATGRPR
jgi:hypothetical protein